MMQLRHGGEVNPGAEADEAPAQRPRPQPAQPVIQQRAAPKVDRNDDCPCGSGLKFRKCHGAALEDESDDASA
jgi:hypothetical protein